jgi:cytochrome c553
MNQKKLNLKSLVFNTLILCFFSNSYADEKAKDLYQQANASTCANCHGTNGQSPINSSIPSIAGLSEQYIILQMKAFKENTRPATVMHQLAKGYTENQINSIAAYYSKLKP